MNHLWLGSQTKVFLWTEVGQVSRLLYPFSSHEGKTKAGGSICEPTTGIEPSAPALGGEVLVTGPPGKSQHHCYQLVSPSLWFLLPIPHPPIKETLLSQASLRQSGADCSCTCEFQVRFPSCKGLLSPIQWFSVHRISGWLCNPGLGREHAFVEALSSSFREE